MEKKKMFIIIAIIAAILTAAAIFAGTTILGGEDEKEETIKTGQDYMSEAKQGHDLTGRPVQIKTEYDPEKRFEAYITDCKKVVTPSFGEINVSDIYGWSYHWGSGKPDRCSLFTKEGAINVDPNNLKFIY